MPKKKKTKPKPPAPLKLWQRMKGEGPKHYRAFLDFCEMGPGRSLNGLNSSYQKRDQSEPKASPEKPPTKRLATLKGWSSKFNWQARLAAWHQDVYDPKMQAEWLQRAEQSREEDWSDGGKLRQLAEKVLAEAESYIRTTYRKVGDETEVHKAIDLKVAIEALKLASKMRRTAAEVQDPAQRLEIQAEIKNKLDDPRIRDNKDIGKLFKDLYESIISGSDEDRVPPR